MAEAVFRSLTESNPCIGHVDSAGIGPAATNEPTDQRTLQTLHNHGIEDYVHYSRMLSVADFQNYDYILAMNSQILEVVQRRHRQLEADGVRTTAKVTLFGKFGDNGGIEQIKDPYMGKDADFERVYHQAAQFSRNFLNEVVSRGLRPNLQKLARDTLEMIIHLFTDTQKLKDRYGCKEISQGTTLDLPMGTSSSFRAIENLAASFSHYKFCVAPQSSIRQLTLKARWVAYDKKKFSSLVTEVKDFINGLQEITKSISTVAYQNSRMRDHIQRINDVETLSFVTEVCDVDHRDISDAASDRLEVLSLTPTRKHDMEQWMSEIDVSTDAAMSEIESLTTTELKHRLLNYMQGRIATEAEVPDHLQPGVAFHNYHSEQPNERYAAVEARLTRTTSSALSGQRQLDQVVQPMRDMHAQVHLIQAAQDENGRLLQLARTRFAQTQGLEEGSPWPAPPQGGVDDTKSGQSDFEGRKDIVTEDVPQDSTISNQDRAQAVVNSTTQAHEYWLPGYALSRKIVLNNIHYFIGPSGTVRPYTYQVSRKDIPRHDHAYSYNLGPRRLPDQRTAIDVGKLFKTDAHKTDVDICSSNRLKTFGNCLKRVKGKLHYV